MTEGPENYQSTSEDVRPLNGLPAPFDAILTDAAKLLTSQVASTIASVILSGIALRYVRQEEFAIVPLGLLLTNVFSVLGGLGLGTACIRLVPEDLAAGRQEQARSRITATVTLVGFSTAVLCLMALLASEWIGQVFYKAGGHAQLIRLLLPGVFLGAVGNMMALLAQSVQRYGHLGIGLAAANIVSKALIIPGYILWREPGIALLSFVGGGVIQVALFAHALREFLSVRSLTTSNLGSLLRYAIPFWGFSAVRLLGTAGDKLLVALFFSPSQITGYYVASSLAGLLAVLQSVFLMPVMTKVAEIKAGGPGGVERLFAFTARGLSYVVFPIVAGMVGLSGVVVRLYAGSEYAYAAAFLPWLALSALAYGYYTLYATFVRQVARPAKTLIMETMDASTNLGFGLLLGPLIGPLGLAMANALSYMVGGCYGAWTLRRIMRADLAWPTLRLVVPASTLMGLALWFAQPRLTSLPLAMLGVVFGGGAYLAIVLLCTRATHRADIFESLSRQVPWGRRNRGPRGGAGQ
jgi:O-antigen/teichoic acid export membrane protein